MEVGSGPGEVLGQLLEMQKKPEGQRTVSQPPLGAREEETGMPSYNASEFSAGRLSMSRATGALHDVQPVVPPLGNSPPLVQTGPPSSAGSHAAGADISRRGERALSGTGTAGEGVAGRGEAASELRDSLARMSHPASPVPVARREVRASGSAPSGAGSGAVIYRAPTRPAAPPAGSPKPGATASRETPGSPMEMSLPGGRGQASGRPGSGNLRRPRAARGKEDYSGGPNYRIGPEDVLHVDVWGNTELTGDFTVRPDGKISMPLIQDVQAQGTTSLQLAAVIQGKLRAYIKDPNVSVIVKEVDAPKFSVLGYVTKPGTYPLRGDLSVLQALSQAGGFTPFASPRKIKLIRKIQGKQESRRVNYYDLIAGGGGENYLLKPGDTIVVP